MEQMNIINQFPGYEYENGKNMYMGTDLGKGGYIISNPGVYGNVALLDIQSLHPNSIRAMNCFGEYTKNFTDLVDARVHIKHGEFDAVRHMFGGRLEKYLKDETTAKELSQALKISINSVYGLTAANFDNPFRDIRNKNNIVALRGALFMRTLQDEVEKRGFQIVAIKTDSIKIADSTKEIVDFCMEFAKKYGYTFEHEATYDRICQINDADYIAKYKDCDWCKNIYGYIPDKNKGRKNEWTATGKQFQIPYVFKSLFTHEPITFDDMCEVFSVKSALYLDMNETLPSVEKEEVELDKLETAYKKGKISDTTFEAEAKRLQEVIDTGHSYQFIGRVGQFCPVKEGEGGGLLRREQNGDYYAASGTTGYRWLESELLRNTDYESIIDRNYYDNLVSDAVDAISKYCDFEWFVSDDPYVSPPRESFMNIPEDAPEELPWDDVA